MKIKYNFFQNERLLVYRILGDFSLAAWKNFYYTILTRKEWGFIENVLVDLRKTDSLINFIDDIEEMKNFRKEVIQKDYKTVFLVDDPARTVFADLYAYQISNMYSCYYCSTSKSAFEFLELNKDHFKLDISKTSLDEVFNN